MDNSHSTSENENENHQLDETKRLELNHSGSAVQDTVSRGSVEREDSLHSLGSQLPAPKTTRPIQRSSRWNSSAARNFSERSLLSTTSTVLTAPIAEDDKETMLLVEKLQDEEIMRRVLEQSLTETSASDNWFAGPMYIHEPMKPGHGSVLHEEPYGFEISRGIDLEIDDELYEMSPRLTPPPSKRHYPPEELSHPSDRINGEQAQVLDLRSSNRSLRSDGSPRHMGGVHEIPLEICSSRAVRSVGSQKWSNQNEYRRASARVQSEQSLSSEAQSVEPPSSRVPLTATSERSLPGAFSVTAPAKVTKTPEVRAAIERFVTQQLEENDPLNSKHDADTCQPPTVVEPCGRKELLQDAPVPKYKYKPELPPKPIDIVETDDKQAASQHNQVWKPILATDSSHLRNGWPSLSRSKSYETSRNGRPESSSLMTSDFELALPTERLSADELKQIEIALLESSMVSRQEPRSPHCDEAWSKSAMDQDLSIEDKMAIADALRKVEESEIAQREEDERRSLEVAMMLQREENERVSAHNSTRHQNQGNVRTMSRAEFASHCATAGLINNGNDVDEDDPNEFVCDGFRMNTTENQRWSRVSKDVVVGPDKLQRTKHDTLLNGKSNAYRLGLDDDMPSIGNTTYNSFMKSSKSMNKGVASTGVGRAGRDSGGTKSGALDENVRLIASKAINRGFINKMNGVVNEGKEAVVYHADAGPESDGFDVAVKVFKRIQEFRGRGEYVNGDSRYRQNFNEVGAREQLEIWADKEFRNLIRANSAGVAVPFPLWTKDNVVFMRFLGNVRPCPQMRDVDLPPGSKRWTKLYTKVIDLIER
jgi:RIO1 family